MATASSSTAASPKCNTVHSEPPPLQQSITIRAVRGRMTFTSGYIDASSSGTRVTSEDAHHPSTRPTLPHSLISAAERAVADPHFIGATSSRRAAGGRSVADIVMDDYRADGAVGAAPVREQQRVPSRW